MSLTRIPEKRATAMPAPSTATPFAVRDCALITLASGVKAQTLREFHAGLAKVAAGSIAHHFWGRLLRPQFDEPEYNNDFASWAYHALHDKPLAERLSMVVPTDYDDAEALRQELLEVIEARLDESEFVPWAKADQQFHFLHAQIVVFDTGLRFAAPSEMVPYLANLSTGSIYYHFIDARSRTPQRCDDFSTWLDALGPAYRPLTRALCALDPYFSSLKEIRQQLVGIFASHCEEAEA
jgi:hypothetical protein